MGSGKTTLSNILARELGFHLLEEKVKENIFLPLYYQDPKQWALYSQIFCLKKKIDQLTHVKELLATSSVVQDTPIYQDCFTYAKAQHALEYMSQKEYTSYLDIFNTYHATLPIPHLIVQINASVPTLEARIKMRAREFEKPVDAQYLTLLSELQKAWITHHPHLRVLEIDTDDEKQNLVDISYQKEVIERVKSAISK